MPTELHLISSSDDEAAAMKKTEQPYQPQQPLGKQTLMHRISSMFGFSKLYNFWLWVVFAGALLGFALARAAYLNFYGVFCSTNSPPGTQLHAAPGECYYYLNFDRYYIGIRLHLSGIIIASFLVLFQFVPIIRHKFRLFHRINGYLVVLLVLLAHAGAIMIADIAFGGSLATQMWVGAVALITVIFLVLAWVNIKRLQIDQHRAYMLRAWFYLASIITERIILALMFTIVTSMGGFYQAMPCEKIAWIIGTNETTVDRYPSCAAYFNGTNKNAHAAVLGALPGNGPEDTAAILDACFAASLWLSLVIHAVGIEIYLQLTPAESARLKQVSYERQLERKFKNPGNAGLTAGSLGDAEPFRPRSTAPLS